MAEIKHPTKIPFEFSKITEYIYIGSNQCCQHHFKSKLLKLPKKFHFHKKK